MAHSNEVIDLLSDDDSSNDDNNDGCGNDTVVEKTRSATALDAPSARQTKRKKPRIPKATQPSLPPAPVSRAKQRCAIPNPYKKRKLAPSTTPKPSSLSLLNKSSKPARGAKSASSSSKPTERLVNQKKKGLQGGIVLQEEVADCTKDDAHFATSPSAVQVFVAEQEKRKKENLMPMLFHDPDFTATPSSIDGMHKQAGAGNQANPKCRCSKPSKLHYITRGPNKDKPCYKCPQNKCRFFRWAFRSEMMHWYRFGPHSNHQLVVPTGFSAQDLVQGKVGDCWFLSALAVIAERHDLILNLFQTDKGLGINHELGVVRVNLFVDGYWKSIVMDNFLPCLIDEKGEGELQKAIQASLTSSSKSTAQSIKQTRSTMTHRKAGADAKGRPSQISSSSSKFDPFAMSDDNRKILMETKEFLDFDRGTKRINASSSSKSLFPKSLNRVITSGDLAYSKAKQHQLWVPFLEKAYAKIHGSYHAISGGHIAEAFLDLTGAPTIQSHLLNEPNFCPRSFWSQLMHWREQGLPMGCGTNGSAGGIVGMHAYSILDVREVRNVKWEFFQHQLLEGSLGNVSGFTEFDGTVRLLRIRNPHGRGEWQGDFSDRSQMWHKLIANSRGNLDGLERTMQNDGTFWMDYDKFLMGFSNVDVVLAFRGNHARSFGSNFPPKKSNRRCSRAFEVRLLDPQPGVPNHDTVELYVMGIQKSRRGASHGRTDRKKSYKVCDMGVLVGFHSASSPSPLSSDHSKIDDPSATSEEDFQFERVEGEMFGFRRNGHHRLVLRRSECDRLVVMPISFGHPAATDKELSFVVRFVSDAPVLIRELPQVPPIHYVIKQYLLQASLHSPFPSRPKQQTLMESNDAMYRVTVTNCLKNRGGVVFIYLLVNDSNRAPQPNKSKQQRRKRQPHRVSTMADLGRAHNNNHNNTSEEGDQDNDGDDGVSFSIELTCRGMSCRTRDGPLAHETVAKGVKFQASWRRFQCDFQHEAKSRLLLVLYQSGQDTEMGHITCVPSRTCGSGNNQTRHPQQQVLKQQKLGAATTTLSRWQKGDTGYSDSDGKPGWDYENAGIFHPVNMTASEWWNGNSTNRSQRKTLSQELATINRGMQTDEGDDDVELQMALALSRNESSCNSPVARMPLLDDDLVLQQAIENSKNEADHAVTIEEDDLAKAIRLSLQAGSSKQISSKEVRDTDDVELVDATSTTETRKKPASENRNRRKLAAEAAMKRAKRFARR